MKKFRTLCVALALCAGVASAAPAKKFHSVSPAKARQNVRKAQARARKNAAKNTKLRGRAAKPRKNHV